MPRTRNVNFPAHFMGFSCPAGNLGLVTGFMKTGPNCTITEIHLLPNIKLALPGRTKHIAKGGQVCFHRRLLANPEKPQMCTTEPVRPLDGINKDVGGAKLLLMTTSTSVYILLIMFIVPVSVPY